MRLRIISMVCALGLVAAAAGGCAKASDTQGAQSAGPPASASSSDAPDGGGKDSPTTTAASRRPKPSPKDPDELANAILDDVESFWGRTLPEVYSLDYETLKKGRIPYDENTPPPACGREFTYEDRRGNAYYCFLTDYIAWDRGELLPALNKKFGEFAVALVMAHEMGHAIQGRIKLPSSTQSIVAELQADCFAGAWAFSQQNREGDNSLDPQPGDLEKGLAALLVFRDQPGSDPEKAGAHGSAFDRVSAFQEGYEEGSGTCAGYLKNPPNHVEMPFSSSDDKRRGGNAPYEETPGLAATDLDDYFAQAASAAGLEYRSVTDLRPYDAPPTCGDRKLSDDEANDTVVYCEADNYIGYDDDFMRSIYESSGDFGVATLLAHQFVVAAQEQSGKDSRSDDAQLQQSCLTGAWSATLVPDSPTQRQGPDALVLSPGDLDETLQAFLAFSQDSDEMGSLSAFSRVKAFRNGFNRGDAACTTAEQMQQDPDAG